MAEYLTNSWRTTIAGLALVLLGIWAGTHGQDIVVSGALVTAGIGLVTAKDAK